MIMKWYVAEVFHVASYRWFDWGYDCRKMMEVYWVRLQQAVLRRDGHNQRWTCKVTHIFIENSSFIYYIV